MNTQNILKFFGSKLDVRLDSSEFYDYEISKTTDDYNLDVLDLSNSITYNTLSVDLNMEDFACEKTTISLLEYDNSVNCDSDCPFSGLTLTLDYGAFVSHISDNFENIILNNNLFLYTGITNEVHYFTISGYNEPNVIDPALNLTDEAEVISGFSINYLECVPKLDDLLNCCQQPDHLNTKPYAHQFIQPNSNQCLSPRIQRRTEKGWTLDFIFNRESLAWSSGSVFYYFGVRGSDVETEYADNNLSFQFTSDRRIKWIAHHYSGVCGTSQYEEDFYIASGQTAQLCTTGDTKDFNITIVFDRYKKFTDCDIENHGGWNDMLGWKIGDYSDTGITAVTSTQLVTNETESESLNKKWADEKERRLGILKIYLNGRPIYKIENWEEIVPSNRGVQPFIQSFGGGTTLMNNIHNGVCCFNIKTAKYYEEPLDYVHVRHNFLTRLNQYDFFICGQNCQDEISGYLDTGMLDQNGDFILTENNDIIVY